MMNDTQALKKITEFMEKENRPYSCQNMIDNLQGKVRMPQTKSICDKLVSKDILTCKEYGKAKIYVINQKLFPETTNEQLSELDDQIKLRKDELAELLKTLEVDKLTLKKVCREMTNELIDSELERLEELSEKLESQVKEATKSDQPLITEEDLT